MCGEISGLPRFPNSIPLSTSHPYPFENFIHFHGGNLVPNFPVPGTTSLVAELIVADERDIGRNGPFRHWAVVR